MLEKVILLPKRTSMKQHYSFLLFALFLPLLSFAQDTTLPIFPADFVGDWSGELEIFNAEGKRMSVPMELLIQPINDTSYTYTIIYGEDKVAGKRDYIIVRGADGPHHWVCDEQNTILLDGYYLGNVYQSVFTVGGSYLTADLEHRGDHLYYSIRSGSEEAVRTTGDATHEEEEIPEVKSFIVTAHQRAVLRKKQ